MRPTKLLPVVLGAVMVLTLGLMISTPVAAASDPIEGDSEVYVMNADGPGVQVLTNNHPGADYSLGWSVFHYRPAWSPDGTKVAFFKINFGSPRANGIYVIARVDIYVSSQRILGWGSFEECVGASLATGTGASASPLSGDSSGALGVFQPSLGSVAPGLQEGALSLPAQRDLTRTKY